MGHSSMSQAKAISLMTRLPKSPMPMAGGQVHRPSVRDGRVHRLAKHRCERAAVGLGQGQRQTQVAQPGQLNDEQQAVFDSHVRQVSGRQESDVPGTLLTWLTRLFFNKTRCPESNSVHIDPFGHVLFCSIFTNYSYGKYPETPVKRIWFSRKHADFMREINTGGSLSVCNKICGQTTRFYVGNPRQLARNLLLRAIRSPLNSRKTKSFQFETPDIEIQSRSEVMEKVDAWRARAGQRFHRPAVRRSAG